MTSRRMLRPERVPMLLSLLVVGSLGIAATEFTDFTANIDVDGDGFNSCSEGCDLRVSTRGTGGGPFKGPSHDPDMVWAGDRTALAWWQESNHDKALFLGTFDGAGEPILEEIQIDAPESSGPAVAPSVAWSGIDLAIAWIRRFRVAFARFTPEGARIGDVVEIQNPEGEETFNPSLVWGGSEYGLFWQHFVPNPLTAHLAFMRIDALGQPIGEVVTLSPLSASGGLSSVWTGDEYAAAWSGGAPFDTEIFLTRIDGFGTPIGTDIQLTQAPGISRAPSLVWTGATLVLVWEDFRDGMSQIYMARFAADGTRLTPDIRISDPAAAAASPSLVWTGSRVAGSWEVYARGHAELVLAQMNLTGVRGTTEVLLGDDTFSSLAPSGASTGTGPAVAWVDGRDLEPIGRFGGEVYFRRVVRADCDDDDAGTWPGAPEICDGVDNDCDGSVDEGCVRRRGRR